MVVNSFIDDDLAADFANKLAGEGVSSSLIPPFSDKKFYRLAVSDHESFDEAQSNADQLKATYGEGLWVLKY